MAGHLVALTPFFMQSEPPAFAVVEVMANLHGNRGTDAGEAVGHGSDHEIPTITVIVKIDQKRCGADAQDRVRLHVLFDWPFRQRATFN
jgi:hypothetical protein